MTVIPQWMVQKHSDAIAEIAKLNNENVNLQEEVAGLREALVDIEQLINTCHINTPAKLMKIEHILNCMLHKGE
jgi:hypothetical protein